MTPYPVVQVSTVLKALSARPAVPRGPLDEREERGREMIAYRVLLDITVQKTRSMEFKLQPVSVTKDFIVQRVPTIASTGPVLKAITAPVTPTRAVASRFLASRDIIATKRA